MIAVCKQWTLVLAVFFGLSVVFLFPTNTEAYGIIHFKDTISDSGPNEQANHSLDFTLVTDLSAGSVIEVTPPPGFTVMSTSTFGIRNVELVVDGTPRTSATSASPGVDMVEITTGTPGFFRYTLAPDFSISSGSQLRFLIGNQTSTALPPITSYSTSTGTTTTPGDTEPIINASSTGVQEVLMEIYDGGLVAKTNFIIFLVEKVIVPNIDTTETIPPYRFNGAPTSSVGGTTLNVEISLETDELAVCKFDTASGTDYFAMPTTMTNTGQIFHSHVVAVTPASVQRFYVRCIDDEGNFNIDDYLIIFTVDEVPTGDSNTDGTNDGDGSGTGDDGSGDGGGEGDDTGDATGDEPSEGGSGSSSGSGGGGGGGRGEDDGDEAGGGFETTDAAYQSGDGRVIISGYAYPNSTVGILVDGNFFDTTRADSDGTYSITLDEIARGVYTFGVYAEDSDDVRSSTFSTSFTVTGARTSHLSNVNVSPSIKVDPDPVEPGEILTVSGYTLPNAEVTIENGRINAGYTEYSATSDARGSWSLTIDTTGFSVDTYQIRAKGVQSGGASTHYSGYTFYGVGQEADVPINADLNRDGFVNLIDFSILLFWWNTDGGESDPPADINSDGTVSLTDFSILLFNWTG